jgi:RimJ/RimL family protein N-acetyltransferase
MEKLKIITERLIITEFDESMAESVHLNSMDADIRRFVPDEVFETVQEAYDTIVFLIECYKDMKGPFVYPIFLKSGENIGYVQGVPIGDEWEVGYHIAKNYTGNGYATEALRAFIPVIMNRLGIDHIWGICHGDNIASHRVLEKSSFILDYKGLGNYKGKNQEMRKYLFRLSL